ncbi:MAG: MFS transporter [Pseudoruegeria sp.]
MQRGPIYLLMATIGIIGANSLALSPIASDVALGLGLNSAPDVMMAAGIYGVAVAISAALLAPQSDRFGAERVLIWGSLLFSLSLFASALAPSLIILIVAQAVAGLAVGVALPSIYSLASHLAPKGQEARFMGQILAGWTLSMVGGVTLSAYIADAFGWRAVYGALTVGSSVSLLCLTQLKLPSSTPRNKATSPITALKIPGVVPGLFSVAMLGTGFYVIYNFIGAHLETGLALPVKMAGPITLFYGVGFALAIFLDPYLDVVGPRRGLMMVFASLILFYAIYASQLDHYGLLVAGAFVWGVIQHLGLNLTVGRLTMIDAGKRGAILGLNSMVMYLSVFVATLIGQKAFAVGGLTACAIISAALAVLGATEAFVARKKVVTSGQSVDPSASPCAPVSPPSLPS